MVPAVGIEPTRPRGTRDFESRASTSSTTPAHLLKEQKNQKNYSGRERACQEKTKLGKAALDFISENKKY